jgi:hypothetical protein
MFVPALRHGGCFALKDDDGAVVAAAVGFISTVLDWVCAR